MLFFLLGEGPAKRYTTQYEMKTSTQQSAKNRSSFAVFFEQLKTDQDSLMTKSVIWLVLVVALLLRIPQLNGSFWLDEAAQALESARPFSQQLQIAEDFQPPLFHIVVNFFAVFSHTEAWLRLASLIPGLIMIWGTYQIALILTNRRVALLSATLLATNSFMIFYAQELRPYAFTGMWAVLSWLCVVKMTQITPSKLFSKSYITYFVLFILTSIGGSYSTYLYPFAFLGQLVYLVSKRQRQLFIHAFLAGVIVTLCFLPWLPSFREQLKIGQQLRLTTQGWESVVSTPQIKALQLVFGKFMYGVIDLDVNVFFVSLTLIFLGTLVILSYLLRRRLSVNVVVVSFCWFLLPVLMIWLFSFFLPVIQPKRVLFALPGVSVFVSMLVVYGWGWQKTKWLSILLGVLLLATHLYGTGEYFLNKQYHREDWRTVISEVDHQFSPINTVIVFGFDHPFSPWDWYTHQPFPTISTGTVTKTEYSQIEVGMTPALNYDNVIVFDYLRDLTDPHHYIEQYLEKYNYHQTQLFDAPQLGFVRVYRKNGAFADAK